MAASAMASKGKRIVILSSIEGLADSLASAAAAHDLPLSFHTASTATGALQHTTEAPVAGKSPVPDQGALCEGTIAVVDPPLIPHAYSLMPHLQWVQSTWAGVDGLFKSLAASVPRDCDSGDAAKQAAIKAQHALAAAAAGEAPPPFTLTRCGGQFGPLMAEYVTAHTTAWVRQFAAGDTAQRSATWVADSLRQLVPLSALTLGVLGGGGGIAKSVLAASKLGFGMRTVAYVSSVRDIANADVTTDSLDSLFGQCDVVVNLLPSTLQTRGLLDGGVFAACEARQKFNTERRLPEHLIRPLFINAGRGDVVSEESVVSALDCGWLGKAVLDVFQTEPLPESSALWKHPKVTITPHVAAVSLPQDVAAAFCTNAAVFLESEHESSEQNMKWVVDWQKGY